MKFITYEGWRFFLVAELPWPRANLLTILDIRNPNILDEPQEPEPESIERTMRVWNLTDCLRVTQAGIRFCVASDWTKSEQQNLDRNLWGCLRSCCEKIPKSAVTLLVSVSFTISSVTQAKFPFLKQANLHDALSSFCLLLFAAVNNLENPDAGFSSVQVTRSTSKPSSYPPLFQDRESDFLSVVNWIFNLVSKGKPSKYFFVFYQFSDA